MTGFKPGSFGIGSDCSANCTTTTAQDANSLSKSNLATKFKEIKRDQ